MIYNGDHEPVISNALYIHIIRRNCCADSFYIIGFSQIQVSMEWGKYWGVITETKFTFTRCQKNHGMKWSEQDNYEVK